MHFSILVRNTQIKVFKNVFILIFSHGQFFLDSVINYVINMAFFSPLELSLFTYHIRSNIHLMYNFPLWSMLLFQSMNPKSKPLV